MAYSYATMLDIAKSNGSDMVTGLIEENLTSAPEVSVLPARTIAGTSYKTLIRTSYPNVAFRPANAGSEPSKSLYSNRTVECFILDAQLEMDKAVADADDQGPDHILSLEADGAAKQSLIEIGSQVWYGTTVDAYGFPGAIEIVDSALVSDAGGSTASTGSSVWGLKLGPKYCQLVFGRGNVLSLEPWRIQTITRSSKELTAYKSSLLGWVGMQWVNKHAVGRIKDITEDSGKGCTDALIATWLAKFPIGMMPDMLFMTRRSAAQLQASRTTVINVDGGSRSSGTAGRATQTISAPMPIESNGIPITVTDSLTNTEALS